MRGVTGFEADLVRHGTILIKLYFSVTREEQAQDRWDEFTECKYHMLKRTSTKAAPWVVVRSDHKQRARLNAIKVMLNAVDYKGRNPALDFTPDPDIVLSSTDEVSLMEADRRRNGVFAG